MKEDEVRAGEGRRREERRGEERRGSDERRGQEHSLGIWIVLACFLRYSFLLFRVRLFLFTNTNCRMARGPAGRQADLRFVVMTNVFDTPLKIHEQYDLKVL